MPAVKEAELRAQHDELSAHAIRAVEDYQLRRGSLPQAIIGGLQDGLKSWTAKAPRQDWRDFLDEVLWQAGYAVEWRGAEIFDILERPRAPIGERAPDRRVEPSRPRHSLAKNTSSKITSSRKLHRSPAPPPSAAFEAGAYSSPPCFMHELDPAWIGTHVEDENPGMPAIPQGAVTAWPEIRRWRKDMRSHLITQRMSIASEQRQAWSARISEKLAATLSASTDSLIGFYWPFQGEYDARPTLTALQDRGVRLALPLVVEKDQPLMFRAWSPGSAMTRGIWNIPIPAEGEPVVPDVVIAPLVGYDEHGYRLGYGGGYYDRTIAAMPNKPLCIGVGFALARLETIHPQTHDIPMDMIHTEAG